MTKKNIAFSLIELSIVILIIGILIAGVTQGSRLVTKSQLESARALSQSSPISSIKGLILWFDATDFSSFANNDLDDQDLVSTWLNVNPQLTNPINATQNTTANKPTYVEKGISKLPSLRFNGNHSGSADANADFFDLGDVDLTNEGQLSVFIVFQAKSAGNSYYLIGHDSGWVRWRLGGKYFQSQKVGESSEMETFTSEPRFDAPTIISAVTKNTSFKLYRDGLDSSLENIVITNGDFVQDIEAYIGGAEDGGNYYFDGFIGEIILFDRALTTRETQDIHKYLRQKWKIS